jgi:uncharacterized protein (TIGR00730 family)
MGRLLAERGLTLVYGGGRVGLMGAVADAVLSAGGEVIGVIPMGLAVKEIAHTGLTDLQIVSSMHERKARMADLTDAFIALPGGFGTFEEFCEIVTWGQLGLHAKPCGLLNTAGYYDPLIAMMDRATEEQFVRPAHRAMLIVESEPEWMLRRIETWLPPDRETQEKWIERDET